MSEGVITIITSVVTVVAVIAFAIFDVIKNKGKNVTSILSAILTKAGNSKITKVVVDSDTYDIIITALGTGNIDDESYAVIVDVLRKIISANYDNEECRDVAFAIASTLVELCDPKDIRAAISKHSEKVGAIISSFVTDDPGAEKSTEVE